MLLSSPQKGPYIFKYICFYIKEFMVVYLHIQYNFFIFMNSVKQMFIWFYTYYGDSSILDSEMKSRNLGSLCS